MRKEAQKILEGNFSKADQKLFLTFANIIEEKPKDNEAQMKIWKYDQKLGGFGGYAAPLNPVINPFNKLEDYRNVFRSLQYARDDMYRCIRPRHIIIDTALHVETLVKIVLSANKKIKFIYEKREFGKNIKQLYEEGIITNDLYQRLNDLRKILNYAKHDTDSSRPTTFDSMDAIVFYFECRKVGNELLKILNHPTYGVVYDIDETYNFLSNY